MCSRPLSLLGGPNRSKALPGLAVRNLGVASHRAARPSGPMMQFQFVPLWRHVIDQTKRLQLRKTIASATLTASGIEYSETFPTLVFAGNAILVSVSTDVFHVNLGINCRHPFDFPAVVVPVMRLSDSARINLI